MNLSSVRERSQANAKFNSALSGFALLSVLGISLTSLPLFVFFTDGGLQGYTSFHLPAWLLLVPTLFGLLLVALAIARLAQAVAIKSGNVPSKLQ